MRLILAAIALLSMQACGCSYFRTTTVSRPRDGLTLVLPGIEGESFINSNIAQGLVDGGVSGNVEVFDWTTGTALRSIEHLHDGHRVFGEAIRLADRIEESQAQDPGRPISIVAHSGGAGIALTALEQLSPERPISSVVLIAPAVSSAYPIQDITDKTTSGIWSFYSPLDLQLTLGTSIAGTIDGDYAPAAGGKGFDSQPHGLTQVPYDPRMVIHGNLGGHLGATNRRFVREQVAPIVRQAHLGTTPPLR